MGIALGVRHFAIRIQMALPFCILVRRCMLWGRNTLLSTLCTFAKKGGVDIIRAIFQQLVSDCLLRCGWPFGNLAKRSTLFQEDSLEDLSPYSRHERKRSEKTYPAFSHYRSCVLNLVHVVVFRTDATCEWSFLRCCL